jgi:hypothetical protein
MSTSSDDAQPAINTSEQQSAAPRTIVFLFVIANPFLLIRENNSDDYVGRFDSIVC